MPDKVEVIEFPKTCCGQPVKWVTVYHRGYSNNVPRCRRDPDCNKLYEGLAMGELYQNSECMARAMIAVMSQGDGLSWHQVKGIIDGVLNPGKVTVITADRVVTYDDGEVGLSEQLDD